MSQAVNSKTCPAAGVVRVAAVCSQSRQRRSTCIRPARAVCRAGCRGVGAALVRSSNFGQHTAQSDADNPHVCDGARRRLLASGPSLRTIVPGWAQRFGATIRGAHCLFVMSIRIVASRVAFLRHRAGSILLGLAFAMHVASTVTASRPTRRGGRSSGGRVGSAPRSAFFCIIPSVGLLRGMSLRSSSPLDRTIRPVTCSGTSRRQILPGRLRRLFRAGNERITG